MTPFASRALILALGASLLLSGCLTDDKGAKGAPPPPDPEPDPPEPGLPVPPTPSLPVPPSPTATLPPLPTTPPPPTTPALPSAPLPPTTLPLPPPQPQVHVYAPPTEPTGPAGGSSGGGLIGTVTGVVEDLLGGGSTCTWQTSPLVTWVHDPAAFDHSTGAVAFTVSSVVDRLTIDARAGAYASSGWSLQIIAPDGATAFRFTGQGSDLDGQVRQLRIDAPQTGLWWLQWSTTGYIESLALTTSAHVCA